MKGRFIHITDTHFALSSSVRTGDLLSDLIEKLKFVVELANNYDAVIIHSGDFFDKPTAPDEVKAAVIDTLKQAKYTPFVISGNHDRLYGSEIYRGRTSLNLLEVAGVIRCDFPYEFDDCVLVSERPLVNHPSGKPLINLWHGFLNKEDGANTFDMTDIYSTTNNLVLLGHDHIPYDEVDFKNTKILRTGSFCRGIRNDSSDRIPVVTFIEIKDGKPVYEQIEISVAKPVELLFEAKIATLTKTSLESYDDIIEALNASKRELDFYEVLSQVTDKETINFIKLKLNE